MYFCQSTLQTLVVTRAASKAEQIKNKQAKNESKQASSNVAVEHSAALVDLVSTAQHKQQGRRDQHCPVFCPAVWYSAKD